MPKPTEEQFRAKAAQINDVSETVYDLQVLVGKVNNALQSLSWAELTDATYDRIFSQYQTLKARLKTLVDKL